MDCRQTDQPLFIKQSVEFHHRPLWAGGVKMWETKRPKALAVGLLLATHGGPTPPPKEPSPAIYLTAWAEHTLMNQTFPEPQN